MLYGTGEFHGAERFRRGIIVHERKRESEGYHLATQQQLIATSVVVVNETSTRSSEMKLVEETKPESFRRLARRELDGESWVELGGN